MKVTPKLLVVIILHFFNTGNLWGCEVKSDTLNISPQPDSVYAHYARNEKSKFFEGYTIQLFSGTRGRALEVRAQYLGESLDGEPRLVYREPNFKIQVGSYPTALDAERALRQIKTVFEDAFVIQTEVPWYPIEEKISTEAADSLQLNGNTD